MATTEERLEVLEERSATAQEVDKALLRGIQELRSDFIEAVKQSGEADRRLQKEITEARAASGEADRRLEKEITEAKTASEEADRKLQKTLSDAAQKRHNDLKELLEKQLSTMKWAVGMVVSILVVLAGIGIAF